MFDTNNLPISGGLVIAGALYIGLSVFVLGPVVATRTIEKSDWQETCQSALVAEVEATRKAPKMIPRMDCQSLVGGFMPSLSQLCNQYGNPDFGGGTTALLQAQEKARRAMEDKRLALAKSKSANSCACAAALTAQDTAWAIHAGSLRLMTPPPVAQLTGTLTTALQSPHCKA
ncbi:MAG: hypothetical protein AAF542_07445 [Pseudomonadota bacterium]